jgi:type IV secretion system protein VirD4
MKKKGIRIGYSRDGRVLRFKRPGHLLTVAPARSGKGRDILVPALLEYPYSCVVVDPKGELACVTHARRRRFGKVLMLNPYNLLASYLRAVRLVRFNPLSCLDPRSIEFAARGEKLSDALIWLEGGYGQETHWTGGARGLTSGINMALARHGAPHEKNLMAMREVLCGDLFGFCREAMKSSDPVIRQKLGQFAAAGANASRSIADIIQTADVQTRFLSDQAIAASLSGSDFRFADLKRQVITVYVILPLDFLDVCGKYFRLIVASALSELLREERGIPVLIMMDEFFQLGQLKAIENAMSMAAGLGVTLWPVLQDLSQLSIYPMWETFLSNAGVRMFFGPRDERTSMYLSNLCGRTERRSVLKSISYPEFDMPGRPQVPNINLSYTQTPRELMLPHETRELDEDEMLLFVDGVKGVIRAKRRAYYDTPEFRGQYRDNPYFSGNGGGLLGLLSRLWK